MDRNSSVLLPDSASLSRVPTFLTTAIRTLKWFYTLSYPGERFSANIFNSLDDGPRGPRRESAPRTRHGAHGGPERLDRGLAGALFGFSNFVSLDYVACES